MTAQQIIFLIIGALILASGIMVVISKRLLQAALWLVVALFGIAVLYAMLQANFLAVVQVIIYIGAIAILFIFTIMLTRREMRDQGAQTNKNWWVAALIGLVFFISLFFIISGQPDVNRTASEIPAGVDILGNLSTSLVSPNAYVLPFEVASVLLLAALIGAVYIATINRNQK
jgi:NADH-quinone oxidoreductase subunit J